jgi:hypothetical protein
LIAQHLHSGRLHDDEARKRDPPAERDGKGNEATEGVPDKVDRATGSAHDRLDCTGLVRDRRIFRGSPAAPSVSTGLNRAGAFSVSTMASAIISGVDNANSIRRPAP